MRRVVLTVVAVAGLTACGSPDPSTPAPAVAASPAASSAASPSLPAETDAATDDTDADAETVAPTEDPGQGVPGLTPVKTCPEVIGALASATKVPWTLTGDTTTADGTRTCGAQASAAAGTPAAALQITSYRTRPEVDTPDKLVAAAQKPAGDCTTNLNDPPDGVGYATSCAKDGKANTTFVLESGWESVSVTADPAQNNFTGEMSRKVAVAVLNLM